MEQLLVEGGGPEYNLERAGRMAARAAAEGCDILLLPECPELASTHPSCLDEGQPVPGPHSDYMAALTKERGIFICCGPTKNEGERIYNTATMIDDQGEILLKYRKINVLEVALPMYAVGDLHEI